MTNKSKVWIGIALGIVTALLLGWNSYSLERAQRSSTFLRLSPDVPVSQGTAIPEAALATIHLPESAGALRTVAMPDTPENRQWLKGRKASHDISPGSILLFQFFGDDPTNRFASTIPAGKRAMSIRVDAAAAVSFLIEPGSLVDVIGSLTPELHVPVRGETLDPKATAKAMTETILQAVRVLAVGTATSHGAYTDNQSAGLGTVTLELSPEQAEKLVYAASHLQNGSLVLVMRNPNDAAAVNLPEKSWADANGPAPAN
jgi:pilus assembly protein CpaB